MTIPQQFDDIRPYEPDELQEAYSRMLAEPQFRSVLAQVMPHVPMEALVARIRSCRTSIDFQEALCYPFLKQLVADTADGCTADFSAIDVRNSRYTFVSNHRDIVLDSAFLSVMLLDAQAGTTCEIGIGDNLLSLPWVRDLVRVTKSFIVKRGLPPRETLMASRTLAEYIHYVRTVKNDNVWIAQREGRAKNADDRTQPAVLKMMAMGGSGSVVERLKSLCIVPLAISYEYDPCDYLKAREMQLKRDVEGWKKSAADDVHSMRTGILGQKGHIHYQAAPCINAWLDTLDPDTPKTEIFDIVAQHIDREIHRNYRIYPYPQLDDYITARIDPHAQQDDGGGEAVDKAIIHERMREMYTNPTINHQNACADEPQ